MRKKILLKRFLALLLSVVLILTLIPIQAFAEGYGGEPETAQTVVISFASLADSAANRSVEVGTALTVESLILPDTLYTTVSDGEDETEAAINGVTWQSEPEYAVITIGEIQIVPVGTYIFTAVLPQGYTASENVALPVIKVTVQPPGIAQYAADVWNGSDNTAFSGSGTVVDPYLIESAANLAYLSAQVAGGEKYADKYFKLTTDINLNNKPWTPIGGFTTYFAGIFDGGGYCISGLNVTTAITQGSYACAGLFGCINAPTGVDTAAVKNLGVKGSITLTSATAATYCGGLVGYLYKGTVSGCYSNVNISVSSVAAAVYAGSLAGLQYTNGYIIACYATGNVSVSTTNINCYVGGVTGYRSSSSSPVKLSGCWDKSSIQTINGIARTQEQKQGVGAGEGDSTFALTDEQIKDLDLLNALSAASGVTWKAGEDGGYPIPDVGGTNPNSSWVNGVFSSGNGSESTPYTISDWKQFYAFSSSVNNGNKYEGEYIRLESDLDISTIGFVPIGLSSNTLFKGSFDGSSKTITGLTINGAYQYCGLFGYIYSSSTVISGVNIARGSVTSCDKNLSASAGLLAGYFENGKIYYCNVQGNVTAISNGTTAGTGGLVGYLRQGQVIGCSARGTVTGTTTVTTPNTNIGGLIGLTLYGCAVTGSYASVDITVKDGVTVYAGGLIGKRSDVTYVNGIYWNKSCFQKINGTDRADGEKLGAAGDGGETGITAKTKVQMKTSDFNNDLNIALNDANWGWSIDSANDGYPYVGLRSALGGEVTLGGIFEVGQNLTANTAALTPADGKGTLYYRWSSDGAYIEDATARVYTITSADAGKVINVTVTAEYCGGRVLSANTTAVASVKATGPDVASVPTLSSKTYNSITVNAVTIFDLNPENTTVEYAIATSNAVIPTNWQSSTTFINLNSSTMYYVYARAKESINYNPGTAKVSTAITTDSNTATISFNANGGNGTMPNVTTLKGSYNMPLCSYSYTNYTFAGWKINNSGTAYLPGKTITIDGDITLYAQWTKNSSSGGSGSGSGSGSGGGSGSGNSYTPPSPTATPIPTTSPAAAIIIDDKEYQIAAVKEEENRTILTINQTKLENQFKTAKDSIVIPVENVTTSTVEAQLVVKNIDDMTKKGMTLTIQTDNISYEIPAAAVDTKALMKELGAADATKVSISIIISIITDAGTKTKINNAVKSSGGEIIVPALQFGITAAYGSKVVEVSTSNSYIPCTMEVTASQAAKITTAVVVEPEGTTRHVPTRVYYKDSKWYAEINSRTNSTYALIYSSKTYTDVEGKWYETAVNEIINRKIMTVEGNKFNGDANITRGEFVSSIVRALGIPATGKGSVFKDVTEASAYYGAIGTAYEYGIITGRSNGNFDPNVSITWQEAMSMIQSAAKVIGYEGTPGSYASYSDASSVSAWAKKAVEFYVGSGLYIDEDKLQPKKAMIRGQAAVIILELLQKAEIINDITTVTMEQTELKKQLISAEGVNISANNDAGTAIIQLTLKNINDITAKNKNLTVESGNVSYTIPPAAINTKELMTEFDTKKPEEITINIAVITHVDTGIKERVQKLIKSSNAKITIPAVQFAVSAEYKGKMVDISTLNGYADCTVEITKEQAMNITTAFIVEPDSTVSNVLHRVYEEDGRWYITVKSNINSTYVFVYNKF